MQQRIEIRRARRRDIRRILELEAACFGRDAWERCLFIDAFSACSDLFFMARLGGRIAGYSIACIQGGRAELISLAVLPALQRRGVARALISATIADLKERGMGTLGLMVGTENEAAIRLYKRLGFVRVRTVPNYYGKGRSAWRMDLRLGSATTVVSLGHTGPYKSPKAEARKRAK